MPALKRSSTQVEHAISQALNYLSGSQQDYGEFRTYGWNDERESGKAVFESSPFVTSLILYSLGHCPDDRARTMIAKGVDFLCAEMEGAGLWRYWGSKVKVRQLLPPDLDDTCCASVVLNQNNRPFPSNVEFVLANRNDRGLYYTWMVPRESTPPGIARALGPLVDPRVAGVLHRAQVADDIDCAVNANVLLYLKERVETKQALDHLIGIVVNGKEEGCSRYYLGRVAVYYMLSRAYASGVRSLAETIDPIGHRLDAARRADGSWGNELLTALAACTMINFGIRGEQLERAVGSILAAQRADGSWRRLPLFRGSMLYNGSEDLTTAVCVEALVRYRS